MKGNNEHQDFVTTLEGSTQKELFTIQLVVQLALFLRNISLPWLFLGRCYDTSFGAYWFKFLIDFIMLVLPVLLSMTIFAQTLDSFLVVLAVLVSLFLFFVFCEAFNASQKPPLNQVLNRIIDEQHRPTMFFTYFQALTLVSMNCAILAVDFPVMPRRFSKTLQFGHSLMDIGVAAAVFQAGFGKRLKFVIYNTVQLKTPRSRWQSLLASSTFLLFAIGLARTVVLTWIGYPQNETEYGTHWNFFFTLAGARIAYSILPACYPTTIVIAVFLGALHQSFLSVFGYQDWILAGLNRRENFFEANAEGLVSLPGYLALYYSGLAVGEYVAKTGIRIKSWLAKCLRLFVLAFAFYGLQLGAESTFGPPSRRVVNLPYIFSQLFLLTFSTACFLLVQMFTICAWAFNVPQFCNSENPFSNVEPCLTRSISRRKLTYFLLGNVLTGVVNMALGDATHFTDDVTAMVVLGVYAFVVTMAVQLCEYKTLKLHRE